MNLTDFILESLASGHFCLRFPRPGGFTRFNHDFWFLQEKALMFFWIRVTAVMRRTRHTRSLEHSGVNFLWMTEALAGTIRSCLQRTSTLHWQLDLLGRTRIEAGDLLSLFLFLQELRRFL